MADVKKIVDRQRELFKSGVTKQADFRIEKLKILRKAVQDHEEEILESLKRDLNKAPFEAYETEVGIVLEEIKYTIKKLLSWVKPKRVKTPIMHFLSTSYTIAEPYGVSLIMSPWNYPFQLAIAPLIGSIAGGNCSVVKPSAFSANTSTVIAKIVKEYFNESFIAVVEGGIQANEALLEEKFDYIFFTGSVNVGKVVMEAASKHLTPVTLELGGKSPCIVDKDANIELAAKRIVWGKFLNAGQTCVAPDYLMVHQDVKTELVKHMRKYIKQFYGDSPCTNGDYPKIINEKHFNRLANLMQSGTILIGGESNKSNLKIAPTVIENVTWEEPVMQEEIFGPLLPVLEFKDLEDVITVVNSHPKPLALYLFTTKKEIEKRIIGNISFGGGCINDTIIHLATSHMPFGGVGESGMGGYHGKSSFNTFTHIKSILKKSNLIDIQLRYPPYQGNRLNIIKKVLK